MGDTIGAAGEVWGTLCEGGSGVWDPVRAAVGHRLPVDRLRGGQDRMGGRCGAAVGLIRGRGAVG